jgi:hypothetical protein
LVSTRIAMIGILLSRSHGIMPPPRRFLPAAKTEFTERTIHN